MTTVEPKEVFRNDRVVIAGKGFGEQAGSVSFGGDRAGSVYSWSDDRIEVEVPSGARFGDIPAEVFSPQPIGTAASNYAPMPGESYERQRAPSAPPPTWSVSAGLIHVRNYLLPRKEGSFVPGVVKFGLVIQDDKVAGVVGKRYGLTAIGRARSGFAFAGKVAPGSEASAIMELSNDPSVVWAEPEFLAYPGSPPDDSVPNDDYFVGNQYALDATHANAVAAWDYTRGTSNVEIAVVDSGIAPSHPDLSGQIIAITTYVGTNGDDHCEHGTPVAGVAGAATNNSQGMAGAGWATRLRIYKIADTPSCTATVDDMARAINQADADGADVINMSYGAGPGEACPEVLDDAVTRATNNGRLAVVLAQNDGVSNPGFPANCENAFAVAATDSNDHRAQFSNYGPSIDLAAPGVGITSTSSSNSYLSYEGTSMAAPLVSGAAALLFAHGATRSQVIAHLQGTADPAYCDCGGAAFGPGRLDMGAAMQALEDTHWYGFSSSMGGTGKTSASPDVSTWGNNNLNVVVRGATTPDIYRNTWSSSGWSGFSSIGRPTPSGVQSGAKTAPATSSWGVGRVDVFTVGYDDKVWHWNNASSSWSVNDVGQPTLTGLRSAPDALSWSANRIHVVAVGNDGNLWLRHYPGSSPWNPWTNLGAPINGISGDPTIVSWSSSRLDIFVKDTFGNRWQKTFNGTWGSWSQAATPATMSSGPDAASWGQDRIDVFWKGGGGDLRRWWWNGSNWSTVRGLGGSLYADPGAAGWEPGRLDIFVRGGDDIVYHRWRQP